MNVVLSEHLPLLASAPNGIQKLRGLILELAVRGKLVPQDPNDEPAGELLKQIAKERAKLETEGKIKKTKALPSVGEDERPFVLPVGWQWVRLADTLAIVTDGDHLPPPKADSGIPFLVIGNLNSGKITFEDCRFVPQKYFDDLDWSRRPTVGDLLYTVTGSFGISIPVDIDKPFCVQRHVAILKTVSDSPTNFLLRYLRSPLSKSFAEKVATGIAQKTVSLGALRLMPIALPPLAEQHRIVAKVDELMALCDRLEQEVGAGETAHAKLVETLLGTLTQSTDADDLAANWQRLAEHFDTLFTTETSIDALKQTVLQLAVMGKLVPQDPNDEPVSELLKRTAKERAKLETEGKIKKAKALSPVGEDEQPFDVPQSWAWMRLSEITTKITDGTHHSPPNLPSGDFKYISAKNIKPWGIDQSGMTFVTEAIHREIFSRCNPEFGDVLYIKDGATTGVAAINTLTEPFSMLSSVALLKPSIGLFNRYLYFLMSSPAFYDEMRAGMTGVAITRVTLAKLNTALLPLPPLPEQHRIVAKVDELMALCDRLKADLIESRSRQERLAATLIDTALMAA